MKELSEYIYLDGMWLQEKQLLKLAMNVGSYALAEHYLCALLVDAVIKGRRQAVQEVNKVREKYGVSPIPLSDEDMEDDKELRGKTRVTAADEKARQIFLRMTEDERICVLRISMKRLIADYHLFIYARHWLGIYMVIRDRLEGQNLYAKRFIKYANGITPADWPDSLKMGLSTYKNFGREILEEDRGEVYYKMRSNPQKMLCDTFWDIVKEAILTTI